ncbi:Hypothetical protein NTJ_15713 [Nesidiocoris tenuis]|uniref:Uncharacterized protein n=1 Tax=Nesidiocoris tenuis TaxID=355587 RepID=A0ABN7BF40_9HEMI|nr:Hypothetical protein NTJ_15713 [Nesidiocoris tenuis]
MLYTRVFPHSNRITYPFNPNTSASTPEHPRPSRYQQLPSRTHVLSPRANHGVFLEQTTTPSVLSSMASFALLVFSFNGDPQQPFPLARSLIKCLPIT